VSQIGACKVQKRCSFCRPVFTHPAQSSLMRLTHCVQKGVLTQSMKLHGASRQSCWHRWMASNPTGSYKGFRGAHGCDHKWELENIKVVATFRSLVHGTHVERCTLGCLYF